MSKVIVEIDTKDPAGITAKYEVNGVVGEGCDALTNALREENEELEYQQTSEYCDTQDRPDYVEEME
jgi:hypothetical protein